MGRGETWSSSPQGPERITERADRPIGTSIRTRTAAAGAQNQREIKNHSPHNGGGGGGNDDDGGDDDDATSPTNSNKQEERESIEQQNQSGPVHGLDAVDIRPADGTLGESPGAGLAEAQVSARQEKRVYRPCELNVGGRGGGRGGSHRACYTGQPKTGTA